MKKHAILCILLLFVLVACNNKPPNKIEKDSYYTCSMHPQVMQDKPGNCPICQMDLIVVKKTNSAIGEIILNDEQVRLGNIQTDTLRNGMIGDKAVLTATLNTNETKVNSINARVMGRIDRLYFKTTGNFVAKGAHLYDLYSEELNNAKQEYLALLEKKQQLDNSIIDFDRLIQSAKTKLLLWGVNEAQLTEMAISKKASPLTPFFSAAAGYITELPVMEGQYVDEGSMIVKLADLSYLWAEAQVYAAQLYSIDKNGTATVQVPDFPGKEFKGKIEFTNPEIATDTRVNLLRISVPNSNGQLKPGMPAYVTIQNRAITTLTIPINSVLRNGKLSVVWVKSGKNSYTIKMVTTGLETGNDIEIKSGLQIGDEVVISGAYLLNSEYIFKKGASPMEGHEMSHR